MRKCKECCAKISAGSKTGYCRKCSKKHFPVWNKGKTKEEFPQLINSGVKLGNQPPNKNTAMSNQQKVKISCKLRDIGINSFNGFKGSEAKRERAKFDSSDVKKRCYERDDYTCAAYGMKGVKLNAHHVESWYSNPQKRFDLNNLITLSEYAHKTFHSIYGSKHATRDNLNNFIDTVKQAPKKTLYVVAGAPGAGKTWICSQLTDIYYYKKYDSPKKFRHLYDMITSDSNKPILYDITTNVSTFIKHSKNLFDIKLVVILEDKDTVKSRVKARGGKFTKSIERRVKRMGTLSKSAVFAGTSDEVLEYLKRCLDDTA